MQVIAEATFVVPVGAALYFYLDRLLFLIKVCWRHVCNLLSIYPMFLNELTFVALFTESFHRYKEPVSLHVLFLPLLSSLCWWNSIENLPPMICIWSEQELRKFVYVITFLLKSVAALISYRQLHLLWFLTLPTILLNSANHISYKGF